MPLELPSLDDRRYADLMDEAQRLIPVLDPTWTNHNPSDPGITLIELFAWLTELLVYRLDRVTDEHRRKFLKLLNGPDWTPGPDLTIDIRDTVRAIRSRDRAVTTADYERLATVDFNQWLLRLQQRESAGDPLDEWRQVAGLDPAVTPPSAVAAVARATCLPNRDLSRATATARAAEAPAHLSLILVPRAPAAPLPDPALLAAVWGWLDSRRMLTTRHHVVGAWFAPVAVELVVAASPGALSRVVQGRVLVRIGDFLDARRGGSDGNGWPFGRDVFLSEIMEQVEQVEGVDYIADLLLDGTCAAAEPRCIAADPLWHAEGDQIGLALRALQLPAARLDSARVVVVAGADVIPVTLTLDLTPASGTDPAALARLKRLVKERARRFFHPLYDGPDPASGVARALSPTDLRDALAVLPDVQAIAIDLAAPAANRLPSGELVVQRGQLVHLKTRFGSIPI